MNAKFIEVQDDEEFDDMAISRFSLRMVVSLLVVVPSAGCIGYLAEAITPWSEWTGDLDFDASRVPEIVVGETTREQIEAMFGKPITRTGRGFYCYGLTRSHVIGDPIFLTGIKIEQKRLLLVMFRGGGDIVSIVSGPEPGAVELLEQLRKERQATNR